MQHKKERGILLEPNEEKGEIAVLNPTLHNEFFKNKGYPFLYRTRRTDKHGEYSTIDLRWLKSPKKLSDESTILIRPEHDYESRSCEDPRITKIGDIYYIVYLGFNELATIPCLVTTKDFKKIKKHGPIGPRINIKKAIKLVDNKSYKNLWKKQMEDIIIVKKNLKISPYISTALDNKDVCIFKHNGEIIMIHRIEPDIQISHLKELKELKDKKFWDTWMKNFNENILLKAGDHNKLGLGSLPIEINNRLLALYHIVDKETKEDIEEYNYRGTFLELDKETLEVKSALRDSLFVPKEEDRLEEYFYKKLVAIKRVYFPTAMIQDKEKIWVYAGVGDKYINFLSTNTERLLKELDKKHNQVIDGKI